MRYTYDNKRHIALVVLLQVAQLVLNNNRELFFQNMRNGKVPVTNNHRHTRGSKMNAPSLELGGMSPVVAYRKHSIIVYNVKTAIMSLQNLQCRPDKIGIAKLLYTDTPYIGLVYYQYHK